MRSRFFAVFAALFGLGLAALAPAPAAAHDCCSSCCGAAEAYVYEGAIGRRMYAPSIYREAYYPAYTTDYYAYRYARPSYYPYYNSGYWRPTRELQYRQAYLRPYSPLPRYYKAWGYPKKHYSGHVVRKARYGHGHAYSRSWRSKPYVVASYRRYGFKNAHAYRHHGWRD